MAEESIAVILTAWKRNYFNRIIPAIVNQSIKPTVIFVYQNKEFIDLKSICLKHGIELISSTYDFKFYGRFSIPILLGTKYCLVLDDDIIPGSRWIENCMRAHKEHNAIIGGAGRVIKQVEPTPGRIGDCPPVEKDTEVDIIIHSYFFKTDWARYIWFDKIPDFTNGEDIHFSVACRLHGGIKAVIPKQPEGSKDLWCTLDPKLAEDDFAAWRKQGHDQVRKKLIKLWLAKGWRPINYYKFPIYRLKRYLRKYLAKIL